MGKAKAAQDGLMHFTFDGAVYPTGMTKKKLKEMDKEKADVVKKGNSQSNYEK